MTHTELLATLERAQRYIDMRNDGVEYVDDNDAPITIADDDAADDDAADDALPIEGALEVMRDDLICEYDPAAVTTHNGMVFAAIAVIGQYA